MSRATWAGMMFLVPGLPLPALAVQEQAESGRRPTSAAESARPEDWFGKKTVATPLKVRSQRIIPHEGALSGIAFSSEGRLLLSAGADRRLRFWNTPTSPVEPSDGLLGVVEERSHEGPVGAVACSPDGKWVAYAGGDTSGKPAAFAVRVESLRGGGSERPQRFEGHAGPVLALAFSPKGDLLASAGADQSVRLWPLSASPSPRILSGHEKAVTSVAFMPEGDTLVSGSADGTVRFWDIASGTQRLKLDTGGRSVSALALRPDGRLLASAGPDRAVRLWDVLGGLEIIRLTGHQSLVAALAFSPGGDILVSGSYDGTLHLWDLSSGDARIINAEGWVTSVAFSPDGRWLAAGRTDGSAILLATPLMETVPSTPARADPEALWQTLGNRDPLKATRAVREWTAALKNGAPGGRDVLVAFLKERLVPIPKGRMEELMKELDDEEYDTRVRATRELERYGAAAEPTLRRALGSNPSAELRTRVTDLLKKLETSVLEAPEIIRPLRAIEILERADLPETAAILESVSRGAETARETQEALSALRRLKKKSLGKEK